MVSQRFGKAKRTGIPGTWPRDAPGGAQRRTAAFRPAGEREAETLKNRAAKLITLAMITVAKKAQNHPTMF